MPRAVARYMPAKIARSVGPTQSFQSRTIAATKAANGRITAVRFA
jgi:hypothetical protein